MKKKIVMLVTMVTTLFTACKKGDELIPPLPTAGVITIKKDTGYHDQFVTPPQTRYRVLRVSSGILPAKATIQNVMAKIDGLSSTNIGLVRNLSAAIMVDAQVFSSNQITPTLQTMTFSSANVSIEKGKIFSLEFYLDFNQALRATIIPSVMVSYTMEGSTDVKKTDWIPGQMISIATGSMQFLLDPTTPAARQIAANQQIETMRFSGTALGQGSTLTSAVVSVVNPSLVQTVRLYRNTNLIGETSAFSGTTATILLNEDVAEGPQSQFSVQLQLKPFVNASMVGLNAKTSILQIGYKTINGENKTAVGTITGTDQYVYKSTAKISSVSLPTTVLQNNATQDLYKWKVAASVFGPYASKQFTVDVTLVDNGTHVDTLSATLLGLKVNGVVATNIRITGENNQIIDSLPVGTTRIIITAVSGTGEFVTPAGNTTEFILTGKLKGFIHPSDGDICKTMLIVTDPQTNYKFANSGVAPDNLNAKLYSSPTANAGAIRYTYIGSDMSDPNHSFTLGGATPDGMNGYLTETDIAAQVLTQ